MKHLVNEDPDVLTAADLADLAGLPEKRRRVIVGTIRQLIAGASKPRAPRPPRPAPGRVATWFSVERNDR